MTPESSERGLRSASPIDVAVVAGATCAMLGHMMVFAWLSYQPMKPEPPSLATAMEAVWVERVPLDRNNSVSTSGPAKRAAKHSPTSTRRPPAHRLTPDAETQLRPDGVEPISVHSDDAWTTPLQSSDLRFETRPEIVARPRADLMEVPNKIHLEMRDSSLVGRLNQMGQAVVCNELRAALRSANGGEAEVIVRTMQDRGCTL